MGDLALALLWGAFGLVLGGWVRALMVALPNRQPVLASLCRLATSDQHRLSRRSLPVLGPCLDMRERPGQRSEAIRRLATEVSLSLAFGWLAWQHGTNWPTLVWSAYAVIFALVIGIDLEHRLILNGVLVGGAAIALVAAATLTDAGLATAVIGGAVGFLFLLLPAVVSGGGLGAGDVKLGGFLGLVTGFPGILTTLTVGIIVGGLVTAVLLFTRRIGRRDHLPYGPFLVAGAILYLTMW